MFGSEEVQNGFRRHKMKFKAFTEYAEKGVLDGYLQTILLDYHGLPK